MEPWKGDGQDFPSPLQGSFSNSPFQGFAKSAHPWLFSGRPSRGYCFQLRNRGLTIFLFLPLQILLILITLVAENEHSARSLPDENRIRPHCGRRSDVGKSQTTRDFPHSLIYWKIFFLTGMAIAK